MTKQSMAKYSSLMNRMALVLLLSCLMVYFCGRFLNFTRGLLIAAEGYNIIADLIFLVLQCVISLLVVFVPMKVFKYLQQNSLKEKTMPVKQEIITKDIVPTVATLGLCATTVAYMVNAMTVSFVAEYTGFSDEYLFLSGLKYGYQIVVYFISLAVIPAIAEELLFRKLLCDALAPYGPKTAIIVTSILFSLMHTNFSRILHTFVLGLFCAWIYVGTKNIKIPMLIHFINNVLAGIVTVLMYRVSLDAATVFFILQFIVCLIISIVCFVRLKNARQAQLLERVRIAKENGEYESYLERQRKYANHIEMMPNENGEEVLSLSKQEKIKGFFSPIMIVFIILVLIQMFYWLSF